MLEFEKALGPRGRAMVPDEIKADLLQRIRSSLMSLTLTPLPENPQQYKNPQKAEIANTM